MMNVMNKKLHTIDRLWTLLAKSPKITLKKKMFFRPQWKCFRILMDTALATSQSFVIKLDFFNNSREDTEKRDIFDVGSSNG